MEPLSPRHRRGQSAVEFVFAFAMFVAFLFVIADFTKILYNWVSITLAIEKASRYGKTVSSALRVPSIHAEVIQIANGLGIALADGDVIVTAAGSDLEVEVTHDINVNSLTGLLLLAVGSHGGTYTLYVKETIKNETFGQLAWT